MNDRIAFFTRRISIYRKDINQFAIDMFQFDADEWQKGMFDDIVHHPKVAVKSGQGVGKTAGTAIVALWFLSCFPNSRVVATAPTGHQLHDVLWSEIAKWQARSPILSEILKWTKTYVYVKGMEKRWFAVARTSTKPENMQGFHEDNMLFIVDEASGVANAIIEAILGTLSGENNKLVMLGNPTKTSGVFYDCFTVDRDLWATRTVSSLDSPRTNKENIRALMRKYGEGSNVIRVRVFGEFPTQEDDVFIPLSLIEKSIMTDYDLSKEEIISIDIGCDVARFGDDKTVIGYKVNKKAEIYDKVNGQNTMTTAKKIAQLGLRLKQKYKWAGEIPIKVDDGGVGGGVVDRLRELKREHPDLYGWMAIHPVHFGAKIPHKYYADTTTLMMAIVRDLISTVDEDGNDKEVELILPNDNDLVAQLSIRKYDYAENGKQRVESKKKMKERDLPSPDEADCILLVCLPVKSKEKKGAKG